jgi:hypothetical protein
MCLLIKSWTWQYYVSDGACMNAKLFYRIAAVLFILFAFGHTFGFLSFRPPSAEGRAVLESMNKVRFEAGGRSYSYGEWYRGFGITITVSMLFWAFLRWHLGNLARTAPHVAGSLGWAFAVQLTGAVLAFLYFGPPAMMLSALVTALVGIGAWLTPR